MLRLIRPSDGGQETRRKPASRACLMLTDAERARLRLVLKSLRDQYGTWKCLAEVMGVDPDTIASIASGKTRGSPGMLLRAARAAGLPLERILSTSLAVVNTCPTCGRST